MHRRGIKVCLLIFLMLGVMLPAPGIAAGKKGGSPGHLVYVPVYSHVYYGDQEKQILLTAILSIRNTDPSRAITLTAVDYCDSQGKKVRSYLPKPVVLKPLASTRFIVAESDRRGGSGASFLVRWQAEAKVNPPLMEGVMIGTAGQQGISFTSRGVAIKK